MSRARVPVLTWHSMFMDGGDYAGNDHIAFAADLRTIEALGLRIVPLAVVARAAVEGRLEELAGCVALSFDDGADSDYLDFPHPRWGAQRSMRNILADFRAQEPAQPTLHATAFAIASPAARQELDRTCMHGCGWWNDWWWREAEADGLIAIESHSWDHNHEAMDATAAHVRQGTFALATRADAEVEIAQASRFIRERRGRAGEVLFAYPYGPASEYLAREYLPDARNDHGVYAAFTTDPRPVSPGDSRWTLPRYVCGSDWRSGDDLERLLREAAGVGVRPQVRLDAVPAPRPRGWRAHFRTWEVNDAGVLAGDLFRHSFGHPIPDYPRHFVLVYSPPHDAADTTPTIVAYVHHMAFEGAYLGGGLCVDAGAYRVLPREIFAAVREAGGLATLIVRDSFEFLDDGAAVFERVGDLRSLAATRRAGFEETGRPQLLVHWLRALDENAKRALVDLVLAHGPF